MITKGLTPLGVMIPDPNKIDLTPPDAELQKQSDEFFDGVVAVKGPTFKDMDSLKKHYQCVFEDAYTAK
ncbi:hypothetical protein GW750_04090 [bacterium]|nr:hypothetical protein [bacterium]